MWHDVISCAHLAQVMCPQPSTVSFFASKQIAHRFFSADSGLMTSASCCNPAMGAATAVTSWGVPPALWAAGPCTTSSMPGGPGGKATDRSVNGLVKVLVAPLLSTVRVPAAAAFAPLIALHGCSAAEET